MMRKFFIFGATSAIAEATARRFAVEGDSFFLIARDSGRLQAVAADLKVRGATQVATAIADAKEFDGHQPLVEEAYQQLGGLDTALIAHGTLADQKACEQSFETTHMQFEINAMGVISLLTHLANRFEQQGFGTISVVSSVAGDRGRQSNYVYGAAKAAVSLFQQGLRNRLHRTGVHVLTIKPGFVDTPMTAGFRKGFLWVKPQRVADGIYAAIRKQKDVVYLPGFWSPVMGLIRIMPEVVFKRLKL